MLIVHQVIRTLRLDKAARSCRVAIGVGLLSAVWATAVALPAGADGTTTTTASASATTTTTPGTGGVTTTTTPKTGTASVTTTTQAGIGEKSQLLNTPDAQQANVTPAGISGAGSSFASPAIETWVNTVKGAPYSLSLNWAPSNSGTGRYEFTNQTVDFAVSDIGYVGNTDTTPPSFPFNFIPITAGGIAFMYNVPGVSKQLQLSSKSACELLTGGITNWDDPTIAADNPGVTLPNVPVIPVTESDSAGTNYVLEEWCIDEQPQVWAAFVSAQDSQSGGPTDGVALSATSPNSNWPGIHGGIDDNTTTAVANDVAARSGGIGAVQVKYAEEETGFGGTDPTKNVALVKNASGDYTGPTPVDVASALAYASQLPNGTHQLNFNGLGPHVYNPSTYSYLLTPTTGWAPAKGDTMSQYVNYVLTLGQQVAPSFGYASLGLSLEQYGVTAVQHNVPGAVPPTASEQSAYSCGDLTPTEVAAGQTTPTCGVTNTTAAPPGANAGTATGAAVAATAAKGASTASKTADSQGGSSSGGSGVDPGVSLAGTSAMASTGIDAIPFTVLGLSLFAIGIVGRRRFLKRRVGDAP
jgi:ABC-type phosphate transport system substrate-binding protein